MSKVKNAVLCCFISALCACSAPSVEDLKDKASMFKEQGDYNAAIVELKNAVALAPNDAATRFELGEAYFNAYQFESSEKEFRKSCEMGYDSDKCLPLLAASLVRTDSFNAVLDIDVNDELISNESKAKVLFYKVQSYTELGQYLKAKVVVNESMQVKTDSLYKKLALAYSAILENDYTDALQQVKDLRAENEENEDAKIMIKREEL